MNQIEGKPKLGPEESIKALSYGVETPVSIDLLLRKGDLLNPLGVLRTARTFDNTLNKNDFEIVIQRNYFGDRQTPIPSYLQRRIDETWNESISILKRMNILKHSSADQIMLKHPTEIFAFR